MHAPARRALWQVSRRKRQSTLCDSGLERRTFHQTIRGREDAKPPTDAKDVPTQQNERAEDRSPSGKTENGKGESERQEETELGKGFTQRHRETQANLENSNQKLGRVEVARLRDLKDKIKEETLEIEKLVREHGIAFQPANPDDKVQQLLERIDKKAELFAQTLDGIPLPGTKRRGRRRTPMGRARYRTPDAHANPKLNLPNWVFDRNVTFLEDRNKESDQILHSEQGAQELSAAMSENPDGPIDGNALIELNLEGASNSGYAGETKFQIHSELYMEIYASIAASFALARANPKPELVAQKTNLALTCALDGGTALLNSIIDSIATRLDADVLRLNAQDLAEIALHNSQLFESSPEVQEVAELGFEIHSDGALGDNVESSEKDDEDEVEVWSRGRRLGARKRVRAVIETSQQFQVASETSSALQDFLSGLINGIYAQNKPVKPRVDGSAQETSDPKKSALGQGNPDGAELETQTTAALKESESNARKQETASAETNKSSTFTSVIPRQLKNRKLIISLEDFLAIPSSSTHIGETLIQTLAGVVHWQRTFFNEQIIIVATRSSSDLLADSSDVSAGLDKSGEGSIFRPIFVSPADGASMSTPAILTSSHVETSATPPTPNIWAHLSGNKTQSINLRNLEHLLKYFSPTTPSNPEDRLRLPDNLIRKFHLRDHVLNKEKISRIVTVAVGLHEIDKVNLDVQDYLPRAMEIIHKCDSQLIASQQHSLSSLTVTAGNPTNQRANKQRMEKLKSRCNKYERQLLSGVLHPENIKVGFGDVHVATDTIDTLKMMTSLSLSRPEAFRYGILKSDGLTGLLMYGPPGTGKTMLAKAVARDSGATVLNISGSEIRQMYVGESEKVIKAVFTLAQKLSPCIVFIDEADSLLGTRAVSETGNTSRRDTINQFLLEWDGMNERNVFLMVATNRPFDLDDAVLRRLPRRLLIDLPAKEDRQSILSLHLREEELDQSVDVAVLAEQTPFYSGSDLKNVVVSAALACVKEENEVAAKAALDGIVDFKYPARRRLTRAHFDKALEEIAASISEDMATLAAMRKWDESYGDRKGRKKKTSWGFVREEVKESNARVRN